MLLSYADCRENAKNKKYPHMVDAETYSDFAEVFSHDHICGQFTAGLRGNINFEQADCLVMDCDNDYSNNEADWVTAEQFETIYLRNMKYIIVPSRNHMKKKHEGELGEQSARPRFHVYFPLSKMYMKANDITALKAKIIEAFPFLDDNAKDASRLIFGVKDPQIGMYLEKELCIDQVQLTSPQQEARYEAQTTLSDAESDGSCVEVASVPNNTQSEAGTGKQSTEIKTPPKKNPKDLPTEAEIVKALSYIHPDCEYKQWAEVGMAIQDGHYPFHVFDNWSKGGQKYQSREDCYTHWKSFQNDKGITVATLLKYAKDGGYMLPDKRFETEHCVDVDNTKVLTENSIETTPFPQYNMLTPEGQARMVYLLFGDKLHYVDGFGWLYFNGKLWTAGKEKAQKSFLWLNQRQRQFLVDNPPADRERLDKLRKFTTQAQHKPFIDGAEGFLQTLTFQSALDFNTDNSIINCDGVIVNLRNGATDEIKPSDLINHSCLCPPSEDGKEDWEAFLRDIFVQKDGKTPDDELITYVQRWLGAALLCDNPNKKVLIAYGEGANGKSTLFNTITEVLCDYCRTLSSEMLDANQKQGRFTVAELFGARLAIFPELPANAVLDEAMIKKLASPDRIQAERKYQAPFSFKPTHTPIVYTNTLPTVHAKDYGTWRRIAILPFYRQFTEGHRDNNLAQKLLANCAGAIMKWLVDGAIYAYEHKYEIPEPLSVKSLVEKYREDNNWIYQFIEDCGYTVDGAKTGKVAVSEVWQKYLNWAQEQGYKFTKTIKTLGKELQATYGSKLATGQARIDGNSVKAWIGMHSNNTLV